MSMLEPDEQNTPPSPARQKAPDEYDGSAPLEIPAVIVAAMNAYCQQAAPIEACGVLAGRIPPRVEAIYPLHNELQSPKRYRADAKGMIRAFRAMREAGERLLAIYHSHPNTQGIPSQTDLAENYYGTLPRIIVSLVEGRCEVRLWRLTEAEFVELEWTTVQPRPNERLRVDLLADDDPAVRARPAGEVGEPVIHV